MVKKTLGLLCASLCLSTLLSFRNSGGISIKTNGKEIHTAYSLGNDSVGAQPVLLADRVEIGKKLANEKKIREIEISKALEKERLEYPAIDIYGDNSWNEKVDPFSGNTSLIPSHYDIDLSNFTMPTEDNRVTSGFGYRRKFHRMHFGTDLDLRTGDPVRAAFDGKVRVVDYERRGYGNYIVIRHPNGLETVYGHLSKTKVKEGDIVKSGDVIGLGGSTGRSTGSHLHFETRFMGIAIDPATLIDFSTGVPRVDNYAFNKNTVSRTWRSRTLYSSNKGQKSSSKSYNVSDVSSSVQVYKIRQGDTLGAISKKFGVSVSKIRRLNGMSNSSFIRAGKTIRVR